MTGVQGVEVKEDEGWERVGHSLQRRVLWVLVVLLLLMTLPTM
eukprot:gene9766-biopygen6767